MNKEVKDLKYWKNNCEEDYIKTPISVLRYITELENKVEQAINFTDSSLELKEKEVLSFDDWAKAQGYKQDFFYFKKDGNYLKPTELYKKYRKIYKNL
jgi:hypothetical protein